MSIHFQNEYGDFCQEKRKRFDQTINKPQLVTCPVCIKHMLRDHIPNTMRFEPAVDVQKWVDGVDLRKNKKAKIIEKIAAEKGDGIAVVVVPFKNGSMNFRIYKIDFAATGIFSEWENKSEAIIEKRRILNLYKNNIAEYEKIDPEMYQESYAEILNILNHQISR